MKINLSILIGVFATVLPLSSLGSLVDEFSAFLKKEYPVRAFLKGNSKSLNIESKLSIADFERRHKIYKVFLGRLDLFRGRKNKPKEKLYRETMQIILGKEIVLWTGNKRYTPLTSDMGFQSWFEFPHHFNVRSDKDFEIYLDFLKSYPTFLGQLQAHLMAGKDKAIFEDQKIIYDLIKTIDKDYLSSSDDLKLLLNPVRSWVVEEKKKSLKTLVDKHLNGPIKTQFTRFSEFLKNEYLNTEMVGSEKLEKFVNKYYTRSELNYLIEFLDPAFLNRDLFVAIKEEVGINTHLRAYSSMFLKDEEALIYKVVNVPTRSPVTIAKEHRGPSSYRFQRREGKFGKGVILIDFSRSFSVTQLKAEMIKQYFGGHLYSAKSVEIKEPEFLSYFDFDNSHTWSLFVKSYYNDWVGNHYKGMFRSQLYQEAFSVLVSILKNQEGWTDELINPFVDFFYSKTKISDLPNKKQVRSFLEFLKLRKITESVKNKGTIKWQNWNEELLSYGNVPMEVIINDLVSLYMPEVEVEEPEGILNQGPIESKDVKEASVESKE